MWINVATFASVLKDIHGKCIVLDILLKPLQPPPKTNNSGLLKTSFCFIHSRTPISQEWTALIILHTSMLDLNFLPLKSFSLSCCQASKLASFCHSISSQRRKFNYCPPLSRTALTMTVWAGTLIFKLTLQRNRDPVNNISVTASMTFQCLPFVRCSVYTNTINTCTATTR
jgi:hypothetical protein